MRQLSKRMKRSQSDWARLTDGEGHVAFMRARRAYRWALVMMICSAVCYVLAAQDLRETTTAYMAAQRASINASEMLERAERMLRMAERIEGQCSTLERAAISLEELPVLGAAGGN